MSSPTTQMGCLMLVFSSLAAQTPIKCKEFATQQMSPALVSLENQTPGSVYQRGEPIHIKLTLRAGPRGVYLPDFFGPFMSTCSHGFFSGVLTIKGKAAFPDEPGCAYAGPAPHIAYVKLNPGETRTWSTDLKTTSIVAGRYCLYAEYLSSEKVLSTGLGLPENKALVGTGKVSASPILIEIR